MLNNIQLKYESLKKTPSDINEHLSVLYKYASECQTILELGVRNIVSTYAFLLAEPLSLTSCDINMPLENNLEELQLLLLKDNYKKYNFIKHDDLTLKLSNTYDLIFIDTWHVYEQMKEELRIYHNLCNKYIILHDIVTYGIIGETPNHRGIYPAVIEFLCDNKNWVIEKEYFNNNGLMILKKIV